MNPVKKNQDAVHGDILVVDDKPENLQVLCSILSEHGHTARPAISGEVALTAARMCTPDLILLDVQMPDMDGFEVCEKMKADTDLADVPIIFISAMTDTDEKIRAFGAGGIDYITKPFYSAEVVARVDSQLRYSSQQIELKNRFENIRQLQLRSVKYSKLQEQLSQLGRSLSGRSDANNCLNDIAQFAKQHCQAICVNYFKMTDSESSVEVQVLSGDSPEGRKKTTQLEDSGMAKILIKEEPRYCSNLSDSTVSLHQEYLQSGVHYLWSLPVTTGNKTIASLDFGIVEQDFNIEDIGLILKTAVSLLGSTLERIRYHDRTEQSLRRLIDENPTMIMVLNKQGIIEQVSRFGAELLGHEATSLVQVPFEKIHPLSERPELTDKIEKWFQQDNGAIDVSEIQMTQQDNQARWTRQTARLTTAVSNNAQVLVVCEDIHETKSLAKLIEKQATTDSLTGLPNRVEFLRRLDHMIALASRGETAFSVMFIDLDKFKVINDTLGHQAGDLVLCELASRIKTTLRKTDTIARIGGDEFLVLTPNCATAQELSATIERLVSIFRQPIELDKQNLVVTGSIGIASYPQDAETGDELIKCADIAMYRAKDLGKNGYQHYCEQFTEEISQRAVFEKELLNAIKNDELSLVFQPKIDTKTQQAYCIEALLRWQHASRGIIYPKDIILAAKSCGLMESLTDWVLDNGIKSLTQLHTRWPELHVAINISALELACKGNLAERVKQVLEKYSLPADNLELQITENSLLEKPELTASLAQEFNNIGVKITIDDFGTGYSSLHNLVHLPIDSIKIDRSFIDNINNDDRKQAVVNGIIAIAKSLGVGCIAEGVEDEMQLDFLIKSGCYRFQGYLFSPPASDNEISEALASATRSALAA